MSPMLANIAFVLIGLAGLFSHWLKRYWRGQTDSTYWRYLFCIDVQSTKAAALTWAVSMFGFLATSPELSMASAYAAFSLGYMIDSAINSG